MRLVTRRAPLAKGGLMQNMLLGLFGLIAVTTQANIHRIRLGKPWLPAGVRAVAVGAIAGRSWMLHLCLLDEFRLIGVAGNAQRFCVGLREHHFSVFGRSVANIALLV